MLTTDYNQINENIKLIHFLKIISNNIIIANYDFLYVPFYQAKHSDVTLDNYQMCVLYIMEHL